ncbi:TPM domain-containing protein [Bacillus sp. T3]|uniref:TPM domain-containing protein n=1 Tax=Bacillus sp. T3 TaxID=467262 RepID=UPI00298194DF|nr:TPM domain-containing protein [Bacillus sp. T3]
MKNLRFFSGIVICIISCLLFVWRGVAEELSIPAPVGDIYVQDFANVLSAQEKAELINMGRALENQTSAQVAVLTVNTTEDVPMEEYANEAFRQFGIGAKQENNGVLVVLALDDRQIRIEVGYGLEGRIPDGKAGRILDQYAIPYLQNQEPNKALIETYKVLANEVLTEYGQEGLQQTPARGENEHISDAEGGGIPSWLLIIIVVVVLFLDFKFFGGFLTHFLLATLLRGGRGGGGGMGGGGFRGGGGGSSGGGGAGRGW